MPKARSQWKQTAQKDACGRSRHAGAVLLRGARCSEGWPPEGLVPCRIQAFPDPQLEASLFSSNPRSSLMKPLMSCSVCPIGFHGVQSNRPRVSDSRAICCFHASLQVSTSPSRRTVQFQFSRSVVSNSLRPHESQHTRPPCPSPSPGVYSDSRPSSR